MSASYNFKDNLTVDNNKYLKWLDNTGTSRANVISLDNDNNVNINSAFGNMNINTDKPNSYTFVNSNNFKGNVLIGTKLGIGFTTTTNMTSSLTLVKNGSIGLNTTVGGNDGYLGMSSWSGLDNNGGSRMLLYGNDHVTYPGNMHLYTGNIANGNVNVYTGNDSLKMQILRDGTFRFVPDGITTRLTINDTMSNFTNDVIISSTTQSYNATSGAFQIRGGIGILGNLYVDGTINLSTATGNINFDSTQVSDSYTSGAIFLSGGIGVSTTLNSSSITSGGALSIAGGAAFAKDVYVGGRLTIINTTGSTSSQTGSFVVYGGMGINDSILSRCDASQIKIAPKTSGSATEITFFSLNNFTSLSNTSSSWRIGQNSGSIGSGKFCLNNSDFGNVFTASYDGGIEMYGKVLLSNTTNATSENDGGAFTVSGGAAFKKNVYIGGSITLAGGGTISGGGGSSEFAYLTLTATDNAINSSTGALFTYGGITVGGENDAMSVTQGGSILTAGGVSIGKSLFVGGPIMQIPVGDTISRPNPAKIGYVRYNSNTSQFEGYGPGDAWGSLGGVVDIAQTTKILASANPSVTDGNLYFFTVGNERMRVNSAGNVGIATTAPVHLLDVNGGLCSTSFTTTNALITNVTTTALNVSATGVSKTASVPPGAVTGTNVQFDSNGGGMWYEHQLPIGDLEGRPYYYSSEYFVTALPLDPSYYPTAFKYVGSSSVSINWRVQTPGATVMTATYTIYVDILDTNGTTIISTPTSLVYSSGLLVTDTGIQTTTLNPNQYIRFRGVREGGGGIVVIDNFIFTYDLPIIVNGLIANSYGVTVGSLTTTALTTGTIVATTSISSGSVNATNSTVTNFVTTTSSTGTSSITTSLLAIGNSNTIGNIFTTGGNVGINIKTPAYHLDINGNVHVNANLYVDGVISGGTETASTFAYLTLTSTDDAINLSTGSILTYGGITIQSPTDAQSVTNGGSFLTDGGASISKRLFVGQDAIIGGDLRVEKTNNATGIGTGGSLTILGGASISKDVYVGGTVTSSSDIRLKSNVENFNTSKMLDKIDNIRSIKYNYKSDDSNTPYVGFIAQDFIEDFPELLRCPEGGYYSLDYQKVSVILMECVKELKTELSQLRNEIKEIKQERELKDGKYVVYL
jgi:hypothetical protein